MKVLMRFELLTILRRPQSKERNEKDKVDCGVSVSNRKLLVRL